MQHTVWTAPKILELSGMYWGSAAIQAGVSLDIFTALADGPKTITELAALRSCDARALDMLVTALTAMGFLRREGEAVSASPEASRFLSRRSPEFLGFIIRHHHTLMPAWAELDRAVRTGGSTRPESSSDTESAQEREDFLMGMFNVAVHQADAAAAAVDLSARKRLLDLGGGPGTYAVYFCRAYPQLSAVIFDKPTTRPFAEKIIRQFGLEDRAVFEGGDFEQGDPPSGFDVVWISQILHGCDGPKEAADVVAKAARCLEPGGRILIQEFMLDDDRNGPLHPALFSLNMLVGTARGQAYTEGELSAMLRAAGASDIQRVPVALPNGCRILSGVMP